ncbi:MAG: c-type cytochrome biogenesis protein CcmI [Sulfitobacter sp.]
MLSFWITALAMTLLVLLVLARSKSAPAAAPKEIDVYRAQLAEVDREAARGMIAEGEAARLRTEIARRILAADKDAADAPAPAPSGRAPMATLLALVFAVPVLLYAGPANLLRLAGAAPETVERWRAQTQIPVKMAAWDYTLPLGVTSLPLSFGGIDKLITPLFYGLGAPGYGDLALADRIDFAEQTRISRPDQASTEAGMPPFVSPPSLNDEYRALLDKLRSAVASRPDDLNGQMLLASNEARIGNFSAAAKAQAAVIALKGDAASVEDLTQLGEFYVLAAGGYVSPEAEMALRTALARDESDGTALYYLATMLIQTGRPDLGFRIWDRQLREGPPDAPWIAAISSQIMTVAPLAGVDYELPAIGTGGAGPSADDIDAAGALSPAERMEMIGGMVSGLSDRLAREGGPPRDWARLITSLGVLGQSDRAAAIYHNALEVFSGDPGALDIINRAGEQAGVAG